MAKTRLARSGRWSIPLLALAATAGWASPPPGAPAPLDAVTIQLEPVVTTGIAEPTFVTNARDGSNRLFLLEQAGRIRVLEPGSTALKLFLDVTSRVLAGGERGLLGLAFHPDYANNRRFFVNYTRRTDGATVVAEYLASTSDRSVAEQGESVLLVVSQPYANHNGGMIEFGPDGFLYVGMGDGGSGGDPGNRAQNPNDLLGKILRIDVDRPSSSTKLYSAPPTNPYAAGGGREEVYALGFRNPWRFSFDRLTGELYAGDVGQNRVEEVDVVRLAGNYGWRVLEGTECYNAGSIGCSDPRFKPPAHEYLQTTSPTRRCSVTGGYVYRGARMALPLGSYVFADYCSGEIFLLEGGAASVLMRHNMSISSFGEDEAGEIYVVGYAQGTGAIHRIVNPNPPPLLTYYVPRLGSRNLDGGEEEHTGLAVVNLDTSDVTLRFTSIDAGGTEIQGAKLSNPAARMLRPGAQMPAVDTEIFGRTLSEKGILGWLKLESTSSRIAAMFLAFTSSLLAIDGADVAAATSTAFVLPEIDGAGSTDLHIVNPGSAGATVTFEIVNASGVPRTAPIVRTIAPQGALVESVGGMFGEGLAEDSDYVRVSANRGVVPLEYLSRDADYAAALRGQDGARGATVLYAPQYASGGPDWRTALSIVNLETASGEVTLELFGDDGSRIGSARSVPIAGRGKVRIEDASFFADASSLKQGYVRVTSSGPRLAGSAVFGDPGGSRFRAALPLVGQLESAVVFGQAASDATWYTGVAFLNPGPAAANIRLELFDAAGALVASRAEPLPAGHRRSRLLTEHFATLVGQNRSSGYIKLVSDAPIASFALFGTQALTALSAIPPQIVP